MTTPGLTESPSAAFKAMTSVLTICRISAASIILTLALYSSMMSISASFLTDKSSRLAARASSMAVWVAERRFFSNDKIWMSLVMGVEEEAAWLISEMVPRSTESL